MSRTRSSALRKTTDESVTTESFFEKVKQTSSYRNMSKHEIIETTIIKVLAKSRNSVITINEGQEDAFLNSLEGFLNYYVNYGNSYGKAPLISTFKKWLKTVNPTTIQLDGVTEQAKTPLKQNITPNPLTPLTPSASAIRRNIIHHSPGEDLSVQYEDVLSEQSETVSPGGGSGSSVTASPAQAQETVQEAQDADPSSVVVDAENNLQTPAVPAVAAVDAGDAVPESGSSGRTSGQGKPSESFGGSVASNLGPPIEPNSGNSSDSVAPTPSTRPNELSDRENTTLKFDPSFTEVMDPSIMKLATDEARGNLGAGTTADMMSADIWGYEFTQHAPDIPKSDEQFLSTDANGATTQSDDKEETNVYSFLPFAKLNGKIVWIPRHVNAARFFFDADDYAELVSHVRDGGVLTLDNTDEVDSLVMMSTIIKTYGTLKMFCQLGPMLPSQASTEQIYAEWLEMRQIGTALAKYQQQSGGMYQNSELSMKGGIRSAVASALKPIIDMINSKVPPDEQLNTNSMFGPKPGSGSLLGGSSRKREAGVIAAEEYNPQFNSGPVDFKRMKFSIPTI